MTDFSPDVSARLIAETREDDGGLPPDWSFAWADDAAQVTTGSGLVVEGVATLSCDQHALYIVRLRNNARPIADQLEAAVREVARLTSQAECDRREKECIYQMHSQVVYERDRMQAVINAICACVDDDAASTDFAYCDEWKLVVSAVDAYRAAKEKP